MVVGESFDHADFVVVGGGPGGYAAAIRAAELGRKVTLIHREGGLGGVCLQEGCIPSKTLIELASTFDDLKHWSGRGLVTDGSSVDLAAFQTVKETSIRKLEAGVASLLNQHRVRVIVGEASFTGSRMIRVLGEHGVENLQFTDVVLATGSSPRALPDLDFDGRRVLDSTGLLALTELPETLCLVGGGYIGLELGMAFARLGTKVTIVEAMGELLPGLHSAARKQLLNGMRRRNIRLITSGQVAEVTDDSVVVDITGAQQEKIGAELVGVAAGRVPNTHIDGLASLGVRVGPSGHIEVGSGRIAAPHVGAIGDCIPGPALAHKAIMDAKIVAETLCGRVAVASDPVVPSIVFTDPELAWVEREVEGGVATAESVAPLHVLGRTLTKPGEASGSVGVVHERESGVILGGHIVGPHASELIAELALAVEMRATIEDLLLTVHPHPTYSEGWREVTALAMGEPLHARPS